MSHIFLEQARLKLGSKTYPLTNVEQVFLNQAEVIIDQYKEQVKIGWQKMLKIELVLSFHNRVLK